MKTVTPFLNKLESQDDCLLIQRDVSNAAQVHCLSTLLTKSVLRSVLSPMTLKTFMATGLLVGGLVWSLQPSMVWAQSKNLLAPLSKTVSGKGQAGWRTVGIPKGKVPLAEMRSKNEGGKAVLELKTQASYGTWVHDIARASVDDATTLSWRWRVDEAVEKANLRTKAGDDAAVKVCVSFDMSTTGLSLGESALLRLARAATGEALPAATLCYVWDAALTAGTVLPNAYTKRVRFITVDSQKGQWRSFSRNIEKDFARTFGAESKTVPPITAVIIGADSDNTKGSSLASVSDVVLRAN